MIKVGITGNIGSGKSLICSIFERINVPVFYADKEARLLYSDPAILIKMKSHFGDEIYDEQNFLKTSILASRIFSSPEDLNYVNNLIHPAVRESYKKWLNDNSNAVYTLYEAAILFETSYNQNFQKIIFVSAPETLRIQRVIERDKSNLEVIKKRMKAQWPENRKIHLADFVINNDGKRHLIPQVIDIHKKITTILPH